MNNHQSINHSQKDTRTKIDKRIAYHQAGHAAAIYLGNKQKQLPAVYFQITKQQEYDGLLSDRHACKYGKYSAKVEGGRLIQSLPLSFSEVTRYFSWPQQEELLCAFEADVINLLAGSLAEAKYLASLDAEGFNTHLINLDALHFYGGSSDLEVISEYMESFILLEAERNRKLAELFLAAFNFVENGANWGAISVLAEFIMAEPKDIIHCEEVISLLESRLAA